mmetsp:Transcript_18037/g.41387  ORF Transcript_18037/g.41387 Transcript_18037/m.41387 type:complete len:139 (+) Transcript_18037:148-564(+)|eukprot:CAMPEP_0172395018 /NCGR_PEP_ID=MMETSP1061-20121228/17528_1 /TAXON_ID=37318 /ORGANISM="Pseudo-nitzschia pungens, Strain cf. pungens" /LENGTH=138 /DNA_ID=CAMNT_0013126491 /DNA_START=131 /DNA_END=547 /DNA_ORIENTATION=-
MRLLTHNFLQSNVRGTTEGYPLKIEATNVIVEESAMDSTLLNKVLGKVNYPGLLEAINDVRSTANLNPDVSMMLSEAVDIPSEPPKDGEPIDDAILKSLHFFLFDIHVLDGILVCPDTGRKFPIKDGIPNMILHEDEV